MDILEETLKEIEKIYMSSISNDEKYKKVSILWEKYYQLKNKYNIEEELEYNLNLLVENECYKINQAPLMTPIYEELVKSSLLTFNQNKYLTENEVHILLKYVIYKTRCQLGLLGIDIDQCSMNGFCELAQRLSIHAFEELGLKVTKNLAENDFNYSLHHCYGTVTFPIKNENYMYNKTYLIDTTYRQFFTSNRCHKGMYYAGNNIKKYPDPGYFVQDIDFAKTIMKDGYIELNSITAKKYGMPFTLSGEHAKEANTINYYNNIINSKDDYYIDENALEDLNVSLTEIINSKTK